MLKEIKSKYNTKYKLLKRLLSNKGRKEERLYIAEGKKFIEYNPIFTFSNFKDDRYAHIEPNLFKELSSLKNSEGLISVFNMNIVSIDNMKGNAVILDRIQNPDNMGAIVRNMQAFKFNNLILTKGSCDPFNPKAVRASMGSIIDMNVAYVSESELDRLKEKYMLYSADINGQSIDKIAKIDDRDMALILGNESRGISEYFLSNSKRVKIDIDENLDSLNVAVASGILMYAFSKKS